jgi:hypothetical protein
LVRAVADGGLSYYIHGDHRHTIPALWSACVTTVGDVANIRNTQANHFEQELKRTES